jgi:hypothetical protein
MQTILISILAIWLLKAAFEITIGLVQIVIGLVAGSLGLCLWCLSFFLGWLEALWHTAFSTSD